MRASSIIIVAIFSNFFGWFIVQWYVDRIGFNRISPFQADSFVRSSIIEMAVIFTICALYYRYRKGFRPSGNYISQKLYTRRGVYWLLTAGILAIAVLQLATFNGSLDTSLRGVGQFDRSVGTALRRILILVFPVFLFYRIAYRRYRFARYVSQVLAFSVVANSISHGDRRFFIYFVLAYFFIIFRERYLDGNPVKISEKFKKYLLAGSIVSLAILAYLARVMTGAGDDSIFPLFVILQGTIGALGIGAILPEVKMIVADNTGYLFGESFLTYFWTLFIPSFVFFLFGGSELEFFRSSYEFDRIFNTNPNMGYDFMMLADFYWNFGYFGYVLYILVAFWVIRTVTKYEHGMSDQAFGLVIILAVFFIAGQRSDFGFFLKSTVYCSIVYSFLYLLAHKRKTSLP